MDRIVAAFHNSARAFARMAARERAFRQELAALVLSVPVALAISRDGRGVVLLVGAVLLVLLVETLNTAIEAACNAVSREFNADIRIAKDCGSLAVLISIVIGVAIWAEALWTYLGGW